MNTFSLSAKPNSLPNVNSPGASGTSSADAAQSRVAFQITSLMSEQAEKLPYDVLTRLRFARDKAVQHARTAASAAHQASTVTGLAVGSTTGSTTVTVGGGSGGNNGSALSLQPGFFGGKFGANFGSNFGSKSGNDFWTRLGSVLPLIALVLGLLCIQNFHQRSQISAAAEVDAALLGDDLPFLAYSDPGFVEFLKSNEH